MSHPENSKEVDNSNSSVPKSTYNRHRQGQTRAEDPNSANSFLRKFYSEKLGKQICLDCGKLFDTEDEIQEHYKNIHPRIPERKYPCDICGKVYSGRDTLAKHTREIHDQIFDDGEEPLFSCEYCDDLFLNSSKLSFHVKTVHKDQKPCNICGKVFDSTYYLRIHKKRKHGIEHMPQKTGQEAICEDCGKICKSQSALISHRKNVHGPPIKKVPKVPVPCEICGKMVTALRYHKKVTHEDFPIPCEVCGEMMKKSKMRRHMWTKHPTGEEEFPYNCDICGKGFFTSKNLEHHINVHTGAKPFKCKYCGLGFAHPRNTQAHEKSLHEGIKRDYSKRKGGAGLLQFM